MNLNERLDKIEDDIRHQDLIEKTKAETKKWKWPFKWKNKVGKASRLKDEKVLVFYLNMKGEWEEPVILPYRDNIIVYKNKIHEFDPRDLTLVRVGNKISRMLVIRGIDRRPVSNRDWDEVRARGDATDSDEILIKAASALVLKPEVAKKPMNWTILIIIGVIIIGGLIFFLSRK